MADRTSKDLPQPNGGRRFPLEIRHKSSVPDTPRTLVGQSNLASPTSGPQSPYDHTRQRESVSNLDLEKGNEEFPTEDGDSNSHDGSPSNNEDEKDPNLIDWEGPNDLENPQNWPFFKKARITVALGIMTLAVTFASSVFSTATMVVAQEFNISDEVAILGTSLFVLGFAVGPIIWGPGSELLGRTFPLFLGYSVFVIFQIPVAVAQNVETIMLCRFIGGAFSSSALAIGGAVLSDIWDPVDRGVAICVWSCSIVCDTFTCFSPFLNIVVSARLTMTISLLALLLAP